MDTGFNWYHDADPSEYDLVVANSEGGLERLRELGARRAEAVHWARRPRVLRAARGREGARRLLLRLRRQVPARVDAGDDRRAVAPAARRRLRARRPRLPAATSVRRAPSRTCRRACSHGAISDRRASTSASPDARTPPSTRRRRAASSSSPPAAPRSSRTRGRESSSGSSPAREVLVVRRRRGGGRRVPRRCSTTRPRPRSSGRRARERVLDEHTYRHRARRLLDLIGLREEARVG